MTQTAQTKRASRVTRLLQETLTLFIKFPISDPQVALIVVQATFGQARDMIDSGRSHCEMERIREYYLKSRTDRLNARASGCIGQWSMEQPQTVVNEIREELRSAVEVSRRLDRPAARRAVHAGKELRADQSLGSFKGEPQKYIFYVYPPR